MRNKQHRTAIGITQVSTYLREFDNPLPNNFLNLQSPLVQASQSLSLPFKTPTSSQVFQRSRVNLHAPPALRKPLKKGWNVDRTTGRRLNAEAQSYKVYQLLAQQRVSAKCFNITGSVMGHSGQSTIQGTLESMMEIMPLAVLRQYEGVIFDAAQFRELVKLLYKAGETEKVVFGLVVLDPGCEVWPQSLGEGGHFHCLGGCVNFQPVKQGQSPDLIIFNPHEHQGHPDPIPSIAEELAVELGCRCIFEFSRRQKGSAANCWQHCIEWQGWMCKLGNEHNPAQAMREYETPAGLQLSTMLPW